MKTIQIAPADNVAVALCPINAGETVQSGDLSQVVVTEAIPQGHKIALKNIAKEENIIKYGFVIGHATTDIPAGSWVHTHNMATNLSGEIEYSYHPELKQPASEKPECFNGFRRKDGRAAIRNEIWIIPTVGCVNDVAKRMTALNQDLVTGTIAVCIHLIIRLDAARRDMTMHRPESFWRRLCAIPMQQQYLYWDLDVRI